MNILGLSFGFHDSAAALVQDGIVVAASQEERFSRIKHDSGFPRMAIDSCLRHARLSPSDLDHVGYYEIPLEKFDRILSTAKRRFPNSRDSFSATVARWVQEERFVVSKQIANALSLPLDRVSYIRHHDSHLASAYLCSGFDRAAVLSIDGVGEWETTAWGTARDGTITRIGALHIPHSLGLFYRASAQSRGFWQNGKTRAR